VILVVDTAFVVVVAAAAERAKVIPIDSYERRSVASWNWSACRRYIRAWTERHQPV